MSDTPPDAPVNPPGEELDDATGGKWRPRRPSPLGLMGPPESGAPKANPWPSLRAIGFMALFAAVVVAVLLMTRGCG